MVETSRAAAAHLRLQLQLLLQVHRCPALAVVRLHSWLAHTRQRTAYLQSQLCMIAYGGR